MKKFLFLFLVFFICQSVFSQNLTVTQFLNLSEKTVGEVDEMMTANNWYFYKATDETEDTFANTKYVFNQPDYKLGGPADYFITYYFSENTKAQAIEIIFLKQEFYESLNNQIKNLKFNLESSSTENGNIVKIYAHKRDIIKVTIPPNFDNYKTYKYQFMSKSSYKRMQ
ncbi:hypothetical protein [Cochleicola gelatinilyticus]|uniref:DUF4833 domain-containing protein n=1 Tax=Cochleicola gelatinilyticus TaxID=1763537 RepID=A0A167HRK3_9FLAO|nr:hypothetical protein [Cochleicola gelatinilyticus]OAB78890.1 hypothetical protein ULVI_09935 [Cochleicola gelatinilyticus]